jgi:hypothetical protein
VARFLPLPLLTPLPTPNRRTWAVRLAVLPAHLPRLAAVEPTRALLSSERRPNFKFAFCTLDEA